VKISYDDLGPEVLVTKDGPVATVTMNLPEHLNSFSDELHHGMTEVWGRLAQDPEVKAAVLTGSGRAFSSGGYLPDFVRNYESYELRRIGIRNAERLANNMVACELPMVAAVNGPAIGLGCTVAVLCDLVVISEDTFMSDPHVSVGLAAGDGGAVAWPLMMSILHAKEYILLGERIPAAECLRLGLANRVVPAGDVLPLANDLAQRLAKQPQQALRDTKRAINLHMKAAVDLVLPFALAAEMESFATPEVRDLAMKFMERKKK
jgi:enoyl-CoA hydratase